ncbi:Nop domain-containing protein [Patellaria atrata CBS 101060]|uniref:Nucleolar protein 58 n=1 Tax=Patellaria atrata CBS 101060 TaxID=1346257 RepID=A0A9P4SFF8_9PEZI|nr:Nop domain-containing protein [Patellaria atrata CBS 101060]
MPLFILAETSAGYALLKSKDKKLLQRDNLVAETQSVESVCSLLNLKQFRKFDSAATALHETTALTDGKVTPMLASLLDTIKDEKKASLAVADPKLGNAINKLKQFTVTAVSDSSTQEIFRAVRTHLTSLIPGLTPEDVSTMSLGLSHSLSRHKVRFSPDKVDTMIIQAIAILDDLDKEINTYAMRVREWYGWHFPEMAKIINDNLAYARVVLKMGIRQNASETDLSEILPEEIEAAVKAAAEISMGTEVTPEDMTIIGHLAEQVVQWTEYRQQISSYLTSRMQAIAPNLTALVGELVGARLIAHAGSLMQLAKSPGSTIQILGAEKALFRALKTKHDTPKYGLIYHASLVGQASGKNKGKIARMLASKAALGVRIDSTDALANSTEHGDLAHEEAAAHGVESRVAVERRLRHLEGKPFQSKGVAIAPEGQQQGKWSIKEARKYNPDADGLVGNEPAAAAPKKPIIEEINGDMEDSSEDEDEEMDDAPVANDKVNGVSDPKAAKKAEKEAKKARKAERAAKREAKAAKKAAKEAKKAAKAAKARKREDGEEKVEKKKKRSKS